MAGKSFGHDKPSSSEDIVDCNLNSQQLNVEQSQEFSGNESNIYSGEIYNRDSPGNTIDFDLVDFWIKQFEEPITNISDTNHYDAFRVYDTFMVNDENDIFGSMNFEYEF